MSLVFLRLKITRLPVQENRANLSIVYLQRAMARTSLAIGLHLKTTETKPKSVQQAIRNVCLVSTKIWSYLEKKKKEK